MSCGRRHAHLTLNPAGCLDGWSEVLRLAYEEGGAETFVGPLARCSTPPKMRAKDRARDERCGPGHPRRDAGLRLGREVAEYG